MKDRLTALLKDSSAYRVFDREMQFGGSHAYLVVSDDGDLLERLIGLMCMRTYCPTACGECAECRKVLSGNKLDVASPNPSGEKMSADKAREVAEDATLGAYEGGAKVYILRRMDLQRDVVQNVLLKTLEEPNPNVMFLLTAASQQGILPTVLSRVKTLPYPKLSIPQVSEILVEEGVKDPAFWARCSGGNLALAHTLLKDEHYVQAVDRVVAMIHSLKKSQDVVGYVFSSDFDRDNITRTLDIMQLVVEDLLLAATQQKEAVTFPNQLAAYQLILNDISLRALPKTLDLVEIAKQKLQSNCNPQSVADSLLLGYLEEKANADNRRN
ncbi:MAG: hypothetical protein J5755_05525 [Clostridia bacterium]|nr:hypothetical protein [Clostridia bacterium]